MNYNYLLFINKKNLKTSSGHIGIIVHNAKIKS